MTAAAGPGHAIPQSSFQTANAAKSTVKSGPVISRRGGPRQPAVVIWPYVSTYYLPSPVVVASPYFCLFHNEAFVSRIGMIDHLSGMHNVPLTTAASICLDDNGNCIFPSY